MDTITSSRRTGPSERDSRLMAAAAALLVGIAWLGAVTSRTAPVLVPLLVLLAVAVAFVLALARRRYGRLPWCEVGVVYAAVVTLYALWPAAGFLLIGGQYTPTNDSRLYASAPDAVEIGGIVWLHVVHLIAFAGSYLVLRGRLPCDVPAIRRPSLSVLAAAVAAVVVIHVTWDVVGLFYDTSSSSYAESYLVMTRLPLPLAQAANALLSSKLALMVLVLVVLFTRYPASGPIIAGWLLVTTVLAVVRLGSRTELVLLVFSAVMIYHLLVRPLPVRLIAGVALGVLGIFTALGLLRAGVAPGEALGAGGLFTHSSEFEVIFANAVHLNQLRERGTDFGLPNVFYVGALANLLPQQIAPYAKIDAAQWYVTTFFPTYAASGGGLAFGVISESILTGGLPSALVRGAVLGAGFAAVHRFYAWHADRLWVLAAYVWITIMCYQAFRNTTFSLVVLFVYHCAPAMAAVAFASIVIDRASRRPGGHDGLTSPHQSAGTVPAIAPRAE